MILAVFSQVIRAFWRRFSQRLPPQLADVALVAMTAQDGHADQVMDAVVTCTVRTARPEDLPAILQIYAAERDPNDGSPRAVSDLEQQTWTRMMRSDDLTVYLAEINDQVVGTATLMTMPNLTYNCAPTAFVEAVVVAIDHRRTGIATAIMRRLLSDARSAGCNKIQLLSHKRHATDGAHRLYTSLGFEPEAEGFRLYLQQVPAAVRAAQATQH
ncbi:GNAT family N-acetyltransferase [Streptosporangium lutulentum]|uniref:GNAT superfamily N-acetyltransferase n=1 Tax=Streptosporangium lutulentum TaxID=1461250 RepID=A0ABT9QLB1_9ACTN|nr:GNAT family N-acetyltransferase [Streptosporangium lutulentum]MDP9847160.1 GNAT superfamily N-acetyltransferase [Streptosporangium lutulentum]